MPPRPFPYPLGIGTDICHVSRLKRLVPTTSSPAKDIRSRFSRLLARFLTWRERHDFHKAFPESDSQPWENDGAWKYLAGRWAAKEAVVKAVQWRRLTFKHVMILRNNPSDLDRTGPLYALILHKPGSAYDYTPKSKHLTITSDSANTPAGQRHPGQDVMESIAEAHGLADSEGAESLSDSKDERFIPAELQYGDLDGQIAKVSISHDGEYATAVCIAAEEPMEGDVGGEAAAREPW